MALEKFNKTLDELKQLNSPLYARFLEVRKICDDAFLKAFDDLTSTHSLFIFFSLFIYLLSCS